MITKEELLEQANTIQISLTEQETDVLLKQINDIFDYVENINEYDCGDEVELQFMTDNINMWREDIPETSVSLQDALKNAPKKNDNFFKVPRVID